MYFELLDKAANCRKDAIRCFALGKQNFARRWIAVGREFVRSAAQARVVFALLGDSSLAKSEFDAVHQEDFEPVTTGSREEWNALSSVEKATEWEDFHDRCALGVADDMYFYRVMMKMHLVGYVGH